MSKKWPEQLITCLSLPPFTAGMLAMYSAVRARRLRPRVDGRERNCGTLAPLASKQGLPPSPLFAVAAAKLGPLTDDTELTKERSHQRRNHDRREHRNFCGVCFPKSGDIRSERRRLSYYSCAARDAAAQVHGGTSCRIFCRRFFSRKPPSLSLSSCLDSFRSIGVSTSSVNLEKGVLFLATER